MPDPRPNFLRKVEKHEAAEAQGALDSALRELKDVHGVQLNEAELEETQELEVGESISGTLPSGEAWKLTRTDADGYTLDTGADADTGSEQPLAA